MERRKKREWRGGGVKGEERGKEDGRKGNGEGGEL